MATIAELKVQYQDLTKELDTMLGGKDIFSDDWSPDLLVMEGAKDSVDKMNAYVKKAQERKGIEDQLTQAESARKLAASVLKDSPGDKDWTFTDPNKTSTGGIKSFEELYAALPQLVNNYRDGVRSTELKFDRNFLKAIVTGGGTQARMPGQQVLVPAYPSTDILSLAEWYGIDSNIYIRYETARGNALAGRVEGGTIADLNPTVPQKTWTLQSLGGFIDIARESLDDIGQLEMAIDELLDSEVHRAVALHASQGTGTGNEWNGLISQITTTAAVAANTVILDHMRGILISAVANGHPYTHFLADAATIGKFVEALDKRGFSQYDRERYPFGYYLGCVPVPMTQLTVNTALFVAQNHMKIIHKGDIEIMMSEDVQFKANAITLRGLIRGNMVYAYAGSEGLKRTTTNNFVVAP